MKRIYLDNAATGLPKAPGVGQAMAQFVESRAYNIGRGSYLEAVDETTEVYAVRQALCRLMGFGGDPRQCAFSAGVTTSLNLLLQGLLPPGSHMLMSAMEHNAVARCAELLRTRGVEVDLIPCDHDGRIRLDEVCGLIRPNTVLACVQHASNVSGTIQPLAELGKILREQGVFLIVDCAQSAGHLPIEMDAWGISAAAFPGHKGLCGPQGIGGAILTPELTERLHPVLAGGTGSASSSLNMPRQMPDRLEAGTLNLPGICGLGAALRYISEVGISNITAHENALTSRFLDAISDNPHIFVPGDRDRAPVVSVQFLRRDNAEAAALLEREYGILTRCGLHCAPLAHRTLGTYPAGTVRFSFSHSTTPEEIDAAVRAIQKIC